MERSNKERPGLRKTPLRRCVVCRAQGGKESFLRAVRCADGKVRFDAAGKAQGRGAYVCKTDACVNKLIKQRGFNRSFKCDAGAEVYQEAAAYIKEKQDGEKETGVKR